MFGVNQTRLKFRERARDDRGAVTTLVAIVLSFGVLLGFSAFVVDLGRGHLEHRTVQNAADAAARSLAQQCAEQAAGCSSAVVAKTQATTLAGRNSFDGVTTVTDVCGASVLGSCVTPPAGTLECRTVPSKYGTSYVRVNTTTRTAEGSSAIPPIFAFNGDDMKSDACAQVVWGKASSAEVELPFVLPVCQFNLNGDAQLMHDFIENDPRESCTVNTLDGPATFNNVIKGFSEVWIPGVGDPCEQSFTVSVGQALDRAPSLSSLCGSDYAEDLESYLGKAVWLPVITCEVGVQCTTGQGSFQYRVSSFVRFTITGFKLQSRERGVAPTGGWRANGCSNNGECLNGTFTRGVSPDSSISDDPSIPSLGLLAVQQIP